MWWTLFPLPLEARQFITRLLCWTVVAGWVLAWVSLPVLLTLFAGLWPRPLIAALIANAYFLAIPVVVFSVALLGLQYGRKCDRCHRALFKEPSPPGIEATFTPDYRARRFLGSFQNGAIWTMARTGSVPCMWCGHTDGAKLDYIVSAPSE